MYGIYCIDMNTGFEYWSSAVRFSPFKAAMQETCDHMQAQVNAKGENIRCIVVAI